MTYNILKGGKGREHLILEVLQAARPAVVVFQEVFDPETVQAWARTLNMQFAFARGNTWSHLALMSRLPIHSHESYRPFPPFHTALLHAVLEAGPGQPLHVFGAHLLAHPFVAFELWRWWEVKSILRRIRSSRAAASLLMGDFNAFGPGDRVLTAEWPDYLQRMLRLQGGRVFRSTIREVLSAGFVDCYRTMRPDEDGYTLPPPRPNARLDYIFASPDLKDALRACDVIRQPQAVDRASDHYPVLAEFDLPV
jgi:exodeoxyribonuclease-3